MAISKRDREKLKQQKKLDKQKRKENRQSGGTSSFEDMIAYVDENGQLCSTPPETPKTKIDVENIIISTPKQEDIEILPTQGMVDYFNTTKKFGFIRDNNKEKYFFHISSAPENIKEGDKVEFEIERGAVGLNAVRISIINK